jgi:chaperonin GroES
VISVGAGKRLDSGETRAMVVKAGDKVLFGKYSGTEVKVDGDELIIMSEDDILAVID